jgi:ABC-2 type transport system ATP-binding protein
MDEAIAVRGLSVDRGGRRVLSGIDCSVPPGTVTGLIGPSGGGKSTLLRSIVGVQRIAAGSVTVLGHPAGSAALRSRVGYQTQAPSVYRDLTTRGNVRYFAALAGVPLAGADETLREVGLTAEADLLVGRLSGGQFARVSLACALVGNPEVLVLDEPTVGLDPVLRRDLWTLFADLAHAGRTVLVSSHVMDEADRCERLLLIREGEILADGSPAEIRDRTGQADLDGAFLRLIDEAQTDRSQTDRTEVSR